MLVNPFLIAWIQINFQTSLEPICCCFSCLYQSYSCCFARINLSPRGFNTILPGEFSEPLKPCNRDHVIFVWISGSDVRGKRKLANSHPFDQRLNESWPFPNWTEDRSASHSIHPARRSEGSLEEFSLRLSPLLCPQIICPCSCSSSLSLHHLHTDPCRSLIQQKRSRKVIGGGSRLKCGKCVLGGDF